jgi:hypothetical protein
MAAPNLREPSLVTGETIGYAVTTTLADALTNAAASGKVFKINAVYCANVDGSLIAKIDLVWRRSGVDTHLAKLISVPAGATQVLVAREAYIYLKEGDSLRAKADVAGDLELTISYEDIS